MSEHRCRNGGKESFVVGPLPRHFQAWQRSASIRGQVNDDIAARLMNASGQVARVRVGRLDVGVKSAATGIIEPGRTLDGREQGLACDGLRRKFTAIESGYEEKAFVVVRKTEAGDLVREFSE